MKKEIIEKIKEIFSDEKVEMKEIIVDDVQELFQFQLPEEYVYILKNYPHAYTKTNVGFVSKEKSDFTNKNGLDRCNHFYSYTEIVEKKKLYSFQLPKTIIPIADVDGGNLICMDSKTGMLYNWIHDSIAEKTLYLINERFDEFILSFTVFENNEIKKDDIISGIDDDLINFLLS